MSHKLEGKIHHIGETQTFASGFSKRELVLETDDKYPQLIPIEFLKERADKLDQFHIGDEVSVEVDIRGREYNGRYYASLAAWKIEHTGTPEKRQEPAKATQEPAAAQVTDEDEDDIPF